MTHIDQIIADALAGSPETLVAILAREVVRLRETPAVVVPEADTVAVCPFCGKAPEVEPYNWKQSGDAWGRVACRNPKCAAEPKVEVHPDDAAGVTGEANSKRCKDAAILKWNTRANQGGADHG